VTVSILNGDCRDMLATLPDGSVQCVVTSPPYFGLRDYGVDGQIGLEPTPDAFTAAMVDVFRQVRRVLRDDGTLWLNLGDSYSTHAAGKVENPMAKSTLAGPQKTQKHANESSRARGDYFRKPGGLPEKNLIGIPWRVAFALQADGWYLRQDIIWAKPNPMPESVRDRCTKAHEYIFLMSKSARYYFDAKAIAEPCEKDPKQLQRAKATGRGNQGYATARGNDRGNSGGYPVVDGTRNKRSVWTVATQTFTDAHFATYPPELIEPCIKAGCPAGGTVLDPFRGAGTTGLVADRLGRNAILIELNPAYAEMAERRITNDAPLFAEVS
jgi:DNA modification methylase